MGKGNEFRKLLSEKDIVVLPGAYDCLSAQIIESLGFDAIDITGFGIEFARLGQPDLGLASMSEVVDQCYNIANSVNIPVIADADTGYGGVLNCVRTARSLEKAGLAGMHIEDQVNPKKCGNLGGKEVIPIEEMCAKISAAKSEVDDFLVIGRSDSRRFGVDEVKRRLHAYLDAGADLVMLGDDYPVPELRDVVGEFRGQLYLVVAVYPGEEMCLQVEEYKDMGVKCVSYPVVSLNAAAMAIREIYTKLKNDGGLSISELEKNTIHIREMEKYVHMDKWIELETRFSK